MGIRTAMTGVKEATIQLSNNLNFHCISEFRESYERPEKEGIETFVIDFRETNSIDSSGLGLLLNAKSFCEGKGIKMRLVNPNRSIMRVFEISRFDKFFDIN